MLEILDYLPFPHVLKFSQISRYCHYLSSYFPRDHFFILINPYSAIIESTIEDTNKWKICLREPSVCQASVIWSAQCKNINNLIFSFSEGKLFVHGGHNTHPGSQNFGFVFPTFSYFDIGKCYHIENSDC